LRCYAKENALVHLLRAGIDLTGTLAAFLAVDASRMRYG
jgi:hypothetical protein